MSNSSKVFEKLLRIMDELRAKCPWDKKQTFETIRHLTIEETYELSEAILDNKPELIKQELGDLLLHIVFYSKIASEKGLFTIEDVIDGINSKLINRHPHIYGDVKVNNSEDVKSNWESIKMKEGKKSVLSGVPDSLPALVKAYRIQEKVKGVGFDWEEPNQVWEKVLEELDEFKREVDNKENIKLIESEFGDLLFALINYARFIEINPEDALERTNRKFKKRFQYLEGKANELGLKLKDMSLAEMDVFWEQAKQKED